MNALVLRSAIVAALGGLLFGFDTAVISGTTQQLTRVYQLSPGGLGFTVATALIGTIFGALIAGKPVDRYGRKKVLFAIGILYFVGALGSAFVTQPGAVPDLPVPRRHRRRGGLGRGARSTPPRSPRPRCGAGWSAWCSSTSCSASCWPTCRTSSSRSLLPAEVAWRWMFAVMAVPAAIFFLLLFTVPETPRWLFQVGRRDEAVSVVERTTQSREEADFEIREIEEALAAQHGQRQAPFFVRQNRKVILLAFAIAVFNQLSGINAILYYAPDIFRSAGAGDNAAALESVIIGLVNLIVTMAALTVIDKIGRRKLMLIGSIGYLVSLGVLAGVFFAYEGQFSGFSSVLVLGGLVVFIAAHAFGQGSVIWVFISEIFPNRIRGRGQSLGSLTHWVFAAVVSAIFPAIAVGAGRRHGVLAVLPLHGRPADLGAEGHARDARGAAGGDGAQPRHRAQRGGHHGCAVGPRAH